MSPSVEVLAAERPLSSVPRIHIMGTVSLPHLAHVSPHIHTQTSTFLKVKLSIVALVPAPKGVEGSTLEAPNQTWLKGGVVVTGVQIGGDS